MGDNLREITICAQPGDLLWFNAKL